MPAELIDREGGREGGRKREREEEREGWRQRGRKREREGGREGGRHRISDEFRKITATLYVDIRHHRVHKQVKVNSKQLTLNRCGYSTFGKHLATYLGVELTVDLTGHHVWVREGIGKEGGERRRDQS
jgi:hypothetical protein